MPPKQYRLIVQVPETSSPPPSDLPIPKEGETVPTEGEGNTSLGASAFLLNLIKAWELPTHGQSGRKERG